jgi:hypothetical protein
MNLQPMALSAPLFLGQGVHEALDMYYKHYQSTGEFDMDVGLKHLRQWCKNRADKMIHSTGVLWEAEREMVNDMYALGYMLLMHYGMWSQKYDQGIEVIGTEYHYRLPVPGMDGVYIAGKIDGVIKYPGDVRPWLLEFKTAASFNSMPWVFRALQCAVYTWAARQIFGDIQGMEYRALLKKKPKDLIPLKKQHSFSQKKNQNTSLEWAKWQMEQYAQDNGLDVIELFNNHQKLLFELQEENKFFMRRQIVRTPSQLDNAVLVLQNIGAQMVDSETPIFAQPGFHCKWCAFADPCNLVEVGEDPSMLLSGVFNTRDYWEGEHNE